jgi:hypothetical protein
MWFVVTNISQSFSLTTITGHLAAAGVTNSFHGPLFSTVAPALIEVQNITKITILVMK